MKYQDVKDNFALIDGKWAAQGSMWRNRMTDIEALQYAIHNYDQKSLLGVGRAKQFLNQLKKYRNEINISN